jgi:hypothetical protein
LIIDADNVGTPEVIDLLESYLETARTHAFSHVAIAMTGYPNIAACDFAGDIALQLGTQEALGVLQGKLLAEIANWQKPPVDDNLDASFVCYPASNAPLGFDFLVWLVDAEMTRIREGAPAPLKVGFWMGRGGDHLVERNNRRRWLNKVFRPLLKFIGAVEDERAIYGRHKALYVPRDTIAVTRAGEKPPLFKTPDQPHLPEGAVTITLREADHYGHRNSNLDAWRQFARELIDDGEAVIFVRDTDKAHEPLGHFATCPEASLDLTARMALYQKSKCNLFVSNGPVGLAHYSAAPWLQFLAVTDRNGNPYPDEFWKKIMGLLPGEQFPWSNPTQRLIWATDSYDNILSAWKSLSESFPDQPILKRSSPWAAELSL